MLVARFSDNIEADIERGWSAWMTPGLGGSHEDCLADYDEFGALAGGKVDIREFPEFPGSFGCVHHEGLSCYALEAENVEDAIEEVLGDAKMNGDGFGYQTIGRVRLLKTISKEVCHSQRDLHILDVDDYESEREY